MATTSSHAAKTISAELRQSRGSRKTQILRAQGKIPGIVYGLAKEAVAIALPTPEAVAILRSGTHIMEVALPNAQPEKMLIQDVQYDYLQTTVEHIDLLRIDPNQKVKVKVALEFRGTPKGAKEGGILETQTSTIELEVLALAIPDSIRVNVEHLEMHQMIHAKEIVLPEGAKLVDFPEKIICQVRTVKEEVAAVEAAPTATEPEVIGKKKEEEGAEGAAPAAPGAKAAAPAAAAAPAKK
ncbi:MAG: 50S ribosomal protein L25 [Phycisphaerales bacterium]|nr:50S ribosomal protein L25 [Phycisphaerales bacterium]